MPPSLQQESAHWLEDFIKSFVNQSPANDLGLAQPEPAWGEPLVAFAAGDDPLWQECKSHIGEFFWTPEEAFRITYPQAPAEPRELSVVAWILPQTAATRNENAGQDIYPSRRWAGARHAGENFNMNLRKTLSDTLNVRGCRLWRPCARPIGECGSRPPAGAPPTGPSATPPISPAWAPLACAMG